jgi:hypothetical protein
VSSGSGPNTRVTEVCLEHEIQVQVQENNSEEVALVQEENAPIPNANSEDVNGLNQFNSDHIISDLRLHIQLILLLLILEMKLE